MDKNTKSKTFVPYPPLAHGSRSADHRSPWELMLFGDLSERQSELLNRLVDVPARSRGILYFDSCGGSVYTGLALATLIRTRELHATAIVVGECSSAALMPFAACRNRFVTAHSTLLFHPMRWQSEEDVRLEEATEWARHFKQLESDLDGLVARLLNLTNEKLATWTRPGRFVNGKELAAEGLATLYDPFDQTSPWKTVRNACMT